MRDQQRHVHSIVSATFARFIVLLLPTSSWPPACAQAMPKVSRAGVLRLVDAAGTLDTSATFRARVTNPSTYVGAYLNRPRVQITGDGDERAQLPTCDQRPEDPTRPAYQPRASATWAAPIGGAGLRPSGEISCENDLFPSDPLAGRQYHPPIRRHTLQLVGPPRPPSFSRPNCPPTNRKETT